MAPPETLHPHGPERVYCRRQLRSAQSRKRRILENEHLAYTKHSFSRVQGPKNTPKVDQSRSKGPPKITSIFASIFGQFFSPFWLHFDSLWGLSLEPKSLKMGRRDLREGVPEPTGRPRRPRVPPRPQNGPKWEPFGLP